MPESLGSQSDDLGPPVGRIRGAADAPELLKLVDQLHHGLAGDLGPMGKLGEPGSGPVDVEEGPGLARAELTQPSVPEGFLHLLVQGAEGPEEHPGKGRLGHDPVMVARSARLVKPPDFSLTGSRYPWFVEIREVRPEEWEEAGQATALAYQEFAPPNDPDWGAYLGEIADVAGRADRTLVLAAVEDGRVLGTATMEFDDRTVGDDDPTLPPDMASLRMLGVDPAYRRRGAARALVEACIEASRSRGKTLFVLRTTERMTAAHRLYESMGMERDPGRDMVFDNGFRLIAYRMPIGPGVMA